MIARLKRVINLPYSHYVIFFTAGAGLELFMNYFYIGEANIYRSIKKNQSASKAQEQFELERQLLYTQKATVADGVMQIMLSEVYWQGVSFEYHDGQLLLVASLFSSWKDNIRREVSRIAGICAKTAVAPLDRMKILVQAQNVAYKDMGVFSGLKSMVKNESVWGLYKGNGAQAIRIFPYSGIQFFSFELYKKNIFGPMLKSEPGQANHMQKLLAGGAAGGTAVIMTYPLDLVRARLTFQVKNKGSTAIGSTGPSRSAILNTLIHAFKNEGGTKALYRGMSATLIAMIPYNACNFYTVDSSKRIALQRNPQLFGRRDPKTGELTLKTQSRLLFAATSAAIANTVGYPLDVARRRMQLALLSSDTAKFSENAFKTLKLIYQENGIAKGLYRGLSINYLRVVPLFAVQYSMNDTIKEKFGLSTGSS